jgi:hypothetical protein
MQSQRHCSRLGLREVTPKLVCNPPKKVCTRTEKCAQVCTVRTVCSRQPADERLRGGQPRRLRCAPPRPKLGAPNSGGTPRGTLEDSPVRTPLSAFGCRGCACDSLSGSFGWQATQQGSRRTPSPVMPHRLAQGRRWARLHRHKGQTVKLLGNPEGQRYRPGVVTSHGHHVVAWG